MSKKILKNIGKRMINEKSISDFYVSYLKKNINNIYEIILFLIQKIGEEYYKETGQNIPENEILKNISESSITFLLDDILDIYSFSEDTYEELYEKLGFKILKDNNFLHKGVIELNSNIFNAKTLDVFFSLFNIIHGKDTYLGKYKIPFKETEETEETNKEVIKIEDIDVIYTYTILFYIIGLYSYFINNKIIFISNELKNKKEEEIKNDIKRIEEEMIKKQEIPNNNIYNRKAEDELTIIEIIEYYINVIKETEELEKINNKIEDKKNIEYIKRKEIIHKNKLYLNNIKQEVEKNGYDISQLNNLFNIIIDNKKNFDIINQNFLQISKIIILLKYINNIVNINIFFIIFTYILKGYKEKEQYTLKLINTLVKQYNKAFKKQIFQMLEQINFTEQYKNIKEKYNKYQETKKDENITEKSKQDKRTDIIILMNKLKNTLINGVVEENNIPIIGKEILNQYILYLLTQDGFDTYDVSEYNYKKFMDILEKINDNIKYINTEVFDKKNEIIFQDTENILSIGYNVIQQHPNLNKNNIKLFIENILYQIENINNAEISILYIFYLFSINDNTNIITTNDFTLFIYDKYCFILSDRINLKMLTSLEIYLSDNPEYRHKTHIFIVGLYEFILNYKEKYLNTFSVPGNTSHYFKELIKYMHYKGTTVSEISITGYYSRQVGYVLIRENDAYKLVKWKNKETYSEILPFPIISNFIKDIMTQRGQVQDEILTDTEFGISGVMYRVAVIKDGDLIHIQIRRGDKPGIDKNYKSRYFELATDLIENRKSEISLYDSYKKEDVATLIRYATQTKGLMIFSAPTGSGKSVSQRNLMSEVVINKVKKEKIFPKVVEITDTIEYRDLNITQIKMNLEEQNKYGARALKRAKPDYIIFSEIRDADFLNTALDLSRTWGVMTTMHSFDILETIQQLKTWGDNIGMGIIEILNSVKIIISQILYPVVKTNIQKDKKILEKFILGNDKEGKEIKDAYLLGYRLEFIDSLKAKGISIKKSQEIWNIFYNTLMENEIIGIIDKKFTSPRLAYEIATKTIVKEMLGKSQSLDNLDYSNSVKLYKTKEEIIIKSIIEKKSPINAIDLCSIGVLPFVIEKMYKNGEI